MIVKINSFPDDNTRCEIYIKGHLINSSDGTVKWVTKTNELEDFFVEIPFLELDTITYHFTYNLNILRVIHMINKIFFQRKPNIALGWFVAIFEKDYLNNLDINIVSYIAICKERDEKTNKKKLIINHEEDEDEDEPEEKKYQSLSSSTQNPKTVSVDNQLLIKREEKNKMTSIRDALLGRKSQAPPAEMKPSIVDKPKIVPKDPVVPKQKLNVKQQIKLKEDDDDSTPSERISKAENDEVFINKLEFNKKNRTVIAEDIFIKFTKLGPIITSFKSDVIENIVWEFD